MRTSTGAITDHDRMHRVCLPQGHLYPADHPYKTLFVYSLAHTECCMFLISLMPIGGGDGA